MIQQPFAAAPATNEPIRVKVTNAFTVGFFGFLGAFVASILFWVIALVVFGACFASAARNITIPTH